MEKPYDPLSARNIIAGILITVFGGIILAFILQDARFAPNSTPTSTAKATDIVIAENLNTSSTLTPDENARLPMPTKTSISTLPLVLPSDAPISAPSETFFGQSKNINGLVVSVSPPDYESGCTGTLDFEVTLSNETSNPIVLSFGLSDIKLFGNGETQLSLYGDYGAATPRCYNGFYIETLAPNSTVKFALRTTDSLGGYSYLELVFGERTGRLAGEKWRLELGAPYDTTRTPFGHAINVEGLEVTVGEVNYFPGCNGTLGFQITLRNTTGRPMILGLRSENLRLYGDNDSILSVYSQLGRQSADCYSRFDLEAIQARDTVLIAVRSTSRLSGLSYVDFVFETDNRLSGLRWRLTLPR